MLNTSNVDEYFQNSPADLRHNYGEASLYVNCTDTRTKLSKCVHTIQLIQLPVRFGVKLRYSIRAVVGSASE